MPRRAVLLAPIVLVLLLSCRGGAARAGIRANGGPIILISIDTLRADHLPAYGYRGVDTPTIERLRRDGLLFEDAWSQCPLTLPSHVSIFTGLLPPEHGVRNNIGYRLDPKAHTTLTRLLRERGYATGAAVSAWVLRSKTGLGDSFDFYDDAIEPLPGFHAASQVQRPGPETVSRAIAWAETVRSRSFFLFLHLYEPHTPYEPPEPYRSRYAQRYDGEIAAADAATATLLHKLDDWGLYDRSTILLLSDHGEGLMDHGEQEHGILLYRDVLQVPLILKLPGSARKGERVKRPAALVDVLPTVIELAGGTSPAGIAGRNLLGPASESLTAIYSETYYPRIHLGWSELRSLADNRFQYIDGPEPELYDLPGDPAEKSNRFPAEREPARALKRALDRIPPKFVVPAAADPEQVRKLAALGYLSGASPSAARDSLPSPMSQIHLLGEIRQAFRLEADGDRKGAIAAFRSLLSKNPGNFDARFKLGQILEADGQLKDAAEAYREAIRLSPSMAGDASIALGKLDFRLGDLEGARANAELAIEDAPAEAHELLARVALDRGELDRAEGEAGQVRGGPGLDARAAVLHAEVALRRNQPVEALEILDIALARLDPPDRERVGNAQFLRGDALARLDRLAEAEQALREEIRLFPANDDAYARLAVIYAVQHRRVKDVYDLLDAMYAANPRPETAELASKTLESLGDRSGASAWRHRAQRGR